MTTPEEAREAVKGQMPANCPNVEIVLSLAEQLEAAQEVIEAARRASDWMPSKELRRALARYDAARKP